MQKLEIDELIEGTAVDVPPHIARLYELADEAIQLEFALGEMPEGERYDRLWQQAERRAMRRVDALLDALRKHNQMEFVVEVMICGS